MIKFSTGSAARIPGSCVYSIGVAASYNNIRASGSAAPFSGKSASSAAPSLAPTSGSTRPTSAGSSASGSTVRTTSAGPIGSSPRPFNTHSSSAKANGTVATTSKPVQFTGAAAIGQNVMSSHVGSLRYLLWHCSCRYISPREERDHSDCSLMSIAGI